MKQICVLLLAGFVIIGAVMVPHRYSSVRVTTVILVRHAEKASVSGDDPPLSREGIERAKALSHVVQSAGIDAIFATGYQRTQATVAPTAAALGLTPLIVNDNQELVHTIVVEHRGEQVLVAGHSNTLPVIIHGLGVSQSIPIAETEYDDLFIVQVVNSSPRIAKLTHLKYGNPSL